MNGWQALRYPTAASLGLGGCSVCGELNKMVPPECSCRHCGMPLRLRKPNSLSRTWAYLLAAAILYIPANLYPVLESRTVAGEERATILQGVVLLWRSGSWPLAVLVFLASIVVPLLKLLAMTLLLVSVHARWTRRVHERTQLFRLLEFVGRWSMLDIYVVAFLVALVRLPALATMDAGPGALAFGAVVVLTMLAAQAFDPRLLWDSAGYNEHT
jgi:paraquat-inducible protein A